MATLNFKCIAVFFLILSGAFAGSRIRAENNYEYLDLRLMAADLVDEMVYSWKEKPPFATTRGVALVELSAPTGLDDRFDTLVENRLYELLRENPDLPFFLVYCNVCRQLVTRTDAQKTTINRGIDQPEVLKGLLKANPDRLALSMSFEAEGKELVLRANIFELRDEQRVLWAKTFSTSSSSRRVLRETAPLVSLETARQQQQMQLNRQENIEFVTRFSVRMFQPESGKVASVAPLLFLEQSFETLPGINRNLRLGITFGATSIQKSLSGWSVGGQAMKLLMRSEPSLSEPDLYVFASWHYVRLRGPEALVFGSEQLDGATVFDRNTEPKATLTPIRVGLEAHVKFRFGLMTFIEYIPQLAESSTIATRTIIGIPTHDIGFGMVLRW